MDRTSLSFTLDNIMGLFDIFGHNLLTVLTYLSTVAFLACLHPVFGHQIKPIEIKSNSVTNIQHMLTAEEMLLIKSNLHDHEAHMRTKRSRFGSSYQQSIVDRHNNLRRTEYSSDMEFMKWNNYLASMAEDWAKNCAWKHGQPHQDKSTLPFKNIGQNLYAYNGSFDALRGIQLWFDEEPYYHYNDGSCDKEPCGHYTQMVWSTSREVGCAYAYCPSMSEVDLINANYLVCNYGPAGNWIGSKPYKKGSACSDCETGQYWCDDGLCRRDCTSQSTECECRAQCQNNGTTVRSNCSCSCAKGWHGPTCSIVCEDKNALCGANPGWPTIWCNRDYVQEGCPYMCALCELKFGAPVTCTTTTTTTTQAVTPPGGSTTTLPPRGDNEVEMVDKPSGFTPTRVSHIFIFTLITLNILIAR